jgi:hypothetical protein
VVRHLPAALTGVPVISHANSATATTRGGGYGVAGGGDLLVTTTGGLGYSIAAGHFGLPGTSATGQGMYVGYNDAAVTGTLPARNATNPYIAYICVQIRDTDEDATGSEDATIVVIQGTPAASPSPPAVPSSLGSLLILSEALVPSSANGGPVVFTERRMYLNAIGGIQRVTSATGIRRAPPCGKGSGDLRDDTNRSTTYGLIRTGAIAALGDFTISYTAQYATSTGASAPVFVYLGRVSGLAPPRRTPTASRAGLTASSSLTPDGCLAVLGVRPGHGRVARHDRDDRLVAQRRARRRRVLVGDDDRSQRPIRRDYLAATTPGKSVIVPIRDGVPFGFAGIVWSRDAPKIAGAGLLSYFDRQPLNTRKSYVATDQHTIVKDLVDWVQANGGNIQVDTSQVGRVVVLRDQTWEQWEEKNIGEAIRQKGDNIGGFDFDIRVEYDAGVLVRRLRLWTPRRGRYYVDDQSNPTFRLDGRRGNVRSVPSTPVDATKLSTNVYALGQEIDATTHERLQVGSVRTDLIAAGWPRLGEVQDLSDIKTSPPCRRTPTASPTCTAPPTSTRSSSMSTRPAEPWAWGTWDLGDDCRVVIPAGETVPWMPDGFSDIRRVTAHEWTWSASQGEALKVHTGRRLT